MDIDIDINIDIDMRCNRNCLFPLQGKIFSIKDTLTFYFYQQEDKE